MLFSGKLYVTALGFIATPMVSRLYNPEEYGVFNLYFAMSAILCVIATGGYNNALLLQKTDKDFHNAVAFTLSVVLIGSFVVTPVLILLFSSFVGTTLLLQEWFYPALIFGTLISSLAMTIPQWNLRRKQFKQSAAIEMTGKTSMRAFQISGGMLIGGYSWILILSDIVGKTIIVLSRLYFTIIKEFGEFRSNISLKGLLRFGKAFKSYPLYDMPAQLLRTFGQQVPVYVTVFFFDLSNLGQYAMATGLMYIPFQLLSTSLSSVFYENITNKKNREEYSGIGNTTRKMILSIYTVGAFPSAILIVYGREILTIFLGQQWTLAGDIGSILALFLLSSLLMGPITSLFRVYRREKSYLIFTILILISNGVLFIVGAVFGDYLLSILLFAISNLVWNLIIIGKAMSIAGLVPAKLIAKGVIIYTLLVALLYSSKTLMN